MTRTALVMLVVTWTLIAGFTIRYFALILRRPMDRDDQTDPDR